MRILVKGGAGFIGSHLVRRLVESGRHTVVNLDALKYSGNLENLADLAGHPQYTFVHADICDQQVVHAVLNEHRIEGIINCAAETHVDRSILDPGAFARTDVVGTGVLLEEARQAGVRRLRQGSADELEGGGERGFVTNAIEGEPLPLYGDGKNCRDWLSVYDHAAGIEHVFDQGQPGTLYNVGGGNERENLTVAEQIVAALGKPRSLIRFVQDRPGHDRRYSIDCSRLRALGWTPRVPFEEGLKQTVEWYRTHESWWRTIKSGEFKDYYQQQYAKRLQKGTACGS